MSEYADQMLTFLWAVVYSWAGFATGGIIVAIVWFWSTLRQVPVSRKVGIALSCTFLFLAFFNAWREQYKKTQPGLRLHILQTMTGTQPDTDRPIVAVIAEVTNLGNPTVADAWHLDVMIKGKPYRDHLPTNFDTPITLNFDRGRLPVQYPPTDILYNKTMASPLPTGMKVTGVILFILSDISSVDSIREGSGSVITLRCKDAFGNDIFATANINEDNRNTEPMGFPGMSGPGPVNPH